MLIRPHRLEGLQESHVIQYSVAEIVLQAADEAQGQLVDQDHVEDHY